MRNILRIACLLIFVNCIGQTNETDLEKSKKRALIIEEHLGNAWKHMLYSKEFQDNIDLGLKKDSTIAYLWQQKAMPYFKSRKCEIGMPFIDKAVKYDAKRYQPYRAFIKCIFARSYKEAIIDFEDCKKKWGNQYEMDHTYDFYIAISNLQLNEYAVAEKLLEHYVNDMLKKNGETWVHPTALFYFGISKYEQQKFEEANIIFDRALANYPNLADAKYYKAICLSKLGKNEESLKLMEEAKADFKKGYTLNEDNVIFEKYPYQVTWK